MYSKQGNLLIFQTGLCNTVLDNPNKLTKEDIVQKIIKYLETDTILYTSGVSIM